MALNALIAENSEIIRRGLHQLLSDFGMFETIRETPCSANITELARKFRPDILFVNPSVFSDTLREKLEKISESKILIVAIVYSLHDEDHLKAYDEVIQVNDQRLKIQRKITTLFKSQETEPKLTDQSLTTRETEVLKLLVKGLSNKEISTALFISTHTVVSHRKNITHKLNIRSVAGLTVYAMLNGLIRLEELEKAT
ncbi:MAG TPA: response regulator transcription factor [Bacteroidales bacterium]|nr:response regulator transcription factor [Bacteroidales bacterium]